MKSIDRFLAQYNSIADQLLITETELSRFANFPMISEIFPLTGLELQLNTAIAEWIAQTPTIEVGNYMQPMAYAHSTSEREALDEARQELLDRAVEQILPIISATAAEIIATYNTYAAHTVKPTQDLKQYIEAMQQVSRVLPRQLMDTQYEIIRRHPIIREAKKFGQVRNFRHHLDIPEGVHGVYFLWQGPVVYVGKSEKGLRKRFNGHAHYVEGRQWITTINMNGRHDISETEAMFISKYKPEKNTNLVN
jgi:hypothetical protein